VTVFAHRCRHVIEVSSHVFLRMQYFSDAGAMLRQHDFFFKARPMGQSTRPRNPYNFRVTPSSRNHDVDGAAGER